jgi:hypothetical protein
MELERIGEWEGTGLGIHVVDLAGEKQHVSAPPPPVDVTHATIINPSLLKKRPSFSMVGGSRSSLQPILVLRRTMAGIVACIRR